MLIIFSGIDVTLAEASNGVYFVTRAAVLEVTVVAFSSLEEIAGCVVGVVDAEVVALLVLVVSDPGVVAVGIEPNKVCLLD